MPRIEQWGMVERNVADPYLAPELRRYSLAGLVYGHPLPDRHPDGKDILTSVIVGRRGDLVVTKSGSEYELGTPHPDYEAQFPNAKQRLFDTLTEV